MDYLIPLLFGYFLGSIPFGLLVCKACGYGDIRAIGSGNIGATNVLRTGNKLLAFLTLVFDIGKGALAVFLSVRFLGADPAILTGLGAILGHCFPVWLRFKGGKGVAVTLGTLLAAVPIAGAAAIAAWLISAALFRISSLAALIAMIAAPIVTYFIYGGLSAIIAALISMLVFIRHHENIKRILKGSEPRIGKKEKNAV